MKLKDILTERRRNAGRDPLQSTKSTIKKQFGMKRDEERHARYEKGKAASRDNRKFKDDVSRNEPKEPGVEVQ